MKQRIKQWWNGRTIVIDDGGYVPRVIERRPWVRTFYENDKTGFWAVVALLTSPIWTDLYTTLKAFLFH
jgi:hypothetical protein